MDKPTNLTNTTWLLNDTPSFDKYNGSYSVNFKANDLVSYNTLTINSASQAPLSYKNATDNVPVYFNGGWYYVNGKTVIFTGGTDIANQNLIDWLYENGTQLNYATRKFNRNLTYDSIRDGTTLKVCFVCNNIVYTGIHFITSSNEVSYVNEDGTYSLVYATAYDGWVAQQYRTIKILGGSDLEYSWYVDWFNSNSTSGSITRKSSGLKVSGMKNASGSPLVKITRVDDGRYIEFQS